MRLWVFCLCLMSTLPSGPAAAFGFCTEPSPPYCLDGIGTFDDEWSFGRCKSEVESYLEAVDDFQSCLISWLERVRSEASDTVDEFNCKAEGRTFCL